MADGVAADVSRRDRASTLKWNMGWMHDSLEYMSKAPIYRRYCQNQITFSLVYAFSENFVLPMSHEDAGR